MVWRIFATISARLSAEYILSLDGLCSIRIGYNCQLYSDEYSTGEYPSISSKWPKKNLFIFSFDRFGTYQSQYCSSDRLEVSLAGCQDLNDGATYCSNTPFVSVSKTNALVMGEWCGFCFCLLVCELKFEIYARRYGVTIAALKTASNTRGGTFFCQIQARQNAMPAQAVSSPQLRYPSTPINTYPMPVLPSSSRPVYQSYQQQTFRQQAMAPIYYPANAQNIVSQPNLGSVIPAYNAPRPFQPYPLQPFPSSQPYGAQPFGSRPMYPSTNQQGFQPMFQPSPMQVIP